jgi:hypothetical protein
MNLKTLAIAALITTNTNVFSQYKLETNSQEKTQTIRLYDDKYQWENITDIDIIDSQTELALSATKNIEVLCHVDSTSKELLREEYLPLKKTIDSLNNIFSKFKNNSITEWNMFEQMYGTLSRNIKNDNIEYYNYESRAIDKLVLGEIGNSIDISAAYGATLSYYGFNVNMRAGQKKDSNGKILGKGTWIQVNFNNNLFDFNPSEDDSLRAVKRNEGVQRLFYWGTLNNKRKPYMQN